MREHKYGNAAGFTQKYRVDRLVWYQEFLDIKDAILWEKRIKGWTRKKKIYLIEKENPTWNNIAV